MPAIFASGEVRGINTFVRGHNFCFVVTKSVHMCLEHKRESKGRPNRDPESPVPLSRVRGKTKTKTGVQGLLSSFRESKGRPRLRLR